MAEPTQDQYAQTDYLSDINVKLRDLEEKQNLIRDRILLIGENLVEEKDQGNEEISNLKNNIKAITNDINKMKLVIQRLIESQDNFARKTEIQTLEKQFKMFEPLELIRTQDAKKLIKEELTKTLKPKKTK